MDNINSNIIATYYVNEKKDKIKTNLKSLINLLRNHIEIQEEKRFEQNLDTISLFFLTINKATSVLFSPYDMERKNAEITLINIEEKIAIINVFLK